MQSTVLMGLELGEDIIHYKVRCSKSRWDVLQLQQLCERSLALKLATLALLRTNRADKDR